MDQSFSMDEDPYKTRPSEPEEHESPGTVNKKKPRYQASCFEWLCKPCLSDADLKKFHVKVVTRALRPSLTSQTKPAKLNFICGNLGTLPGEKKLMVSEVKQNCVYMHKKTFKFVSAEFVSAGSAGGGWKLLSDDKKMMPLCIVYDGVVIKLPWDLIEMDIKFERFRNIVDGRCIEIDYLTENQFVAVLGYVEQNMDEGEFDFEMYPIGSDRIEEMNIEGLLAEQEIQSLESMKGHIMMTNSEAVLSCVEPDEQCGYATFFKNWQEKERAVAAEKKMNEMQVAAEKKKNEIQAKKNEIQAAMKCIDAMPVQKMKELLKDFVKKGKINQKQLKKIHEIMLE